MLPIAMAVTWGGYGLATWGWCVLKGYDITFTQWFDPVHPYEWTGGTPPQIPPTQMWPAAAAKKVQPAALA